MRVALVLRKGDNKSSASQKQLKWDYDKTRARDPFVGLKELVSIDSLSPAVRMGSSSNTDKPTYNELMTRSDAPIRIIGMQQHTLPID